MQHLHALSTGCLTLMLVACRCQKGSAVLLSKFSQVVDPHFLSSLVSPVASWAVCSVTEHTPSPLPCPEKSPTGLG